VKFRRYFPALFALLASSTYAHSTYGQTLRLEAKLDTPVAMRSAMTCNSGAQVVAIGKDGAIYLWDLPATASRKISVAEGRVESLDCDAHGSLAVALDGGRVRVLDAKSGEIRQRIDAKFPVGTVSLSPDGALLAIATTRIPTQLWDARSGQKISSTVTNMGAAWTVAFSPAGDVFVAADEDTKIRAYNRAGKLLYTADAGLLEPFAITFSADGKRVAVGGAEGNVLLFDTASGKKLQTSATTGNPIFGLCMSPDNGHIAVFEVDDFKLAPAAIGLWDPRTPEVKHPGFDTKGAIGFGTNKTHALLLRQEDPKTLTVSSLQ
jgi:WD40 repeat protein